MLTYSLESNPLVSNANFLQLLQHRSAKSGVTNCAPPPQPVPQNGNGLAVKCDSLK